MKTIEIEYETHMQYKILRALAESLESESVNMDKFLIWVLKTYGYGESLCLKILQGSGGTNG